MFEKVKKFLANLLMYSVYAVFFGAIAWNTFFNDSGCGESRYYPVDDCE